MQVHDERLMLGTTGRPFLSEHSRDRGHCGLLCPLDMDPLAESRAGGGRPDGVSVESGRGLKLVTRGGWQIGINTAGSLPVRPRCRILPVINFRRPSRLPMLPIVLTTLCPQTGTMYI